ncbi:uncharacterized protein LOC126683732 [Mercurialis annua]|uniref:uncharacterized protein LOC126683732 n=1 Tax=Mercurialis annua TaxID=3986 RepID=UPI0021603B7A|nr:uncharacterized protein LOC126683732 [Mercurialis annua]XP_050235392.1 uncharacterized protein LOC126683732 [Mercurialis annua]
MSSHMSEQVNTDQQLQNVNSSNFIDEDDGDNEGEEEEEDDVDFNPFLKGTPSPEASSSLSSEVEELTSNSSKKIVSYDVGDCEHGEEVVMQNADVFSSESEKKFTNKKRKSEFVDKLGNKSVQENVDNKNESLNDKDENEDEDMDAIWKRTRARYSLTSFTLDELETFLQETDDEDDLQNVDDEQEYRKFLAAVLLGGGDGDCDGQSGKDIENVDDDEDNDADFEIELEELLESDVDDNKRDADQKVEYKRGCQRRETRQNRRQKASDQYKRKLLEQTKRPLRPLLPILPNRPVGSFPTADGKVSALETAPSHITSGAEHGLINGFTPQQIGQLHCLIHEHVQLLVQVFSLCILDPCRQTIANQVQGMLFELLHKHDETIACRSVPYPSICFQPSYMCPSVIEDLPNLIPPQHRETTSDSNMQMVVFQDVSPTTGRKDHNSNKPIGTSPNAGSFWAPFVAHPVTCILNVAPLSLVRPFMDDVSNAVREYRQRHLDSSCDAWNERESLFHLPHFPSVAEETGEVSNGNLALAVCAVPSTSGRQPPKKTLAASIVEKVKKQSIALVPKDISKLAQRFRPLFNPALFPHKLPPAAVANRVLFTDSEDELLALGMMEYNTDWKAIQQRFLPCKSKHQIFVRQKNRCSSKAPENPIKAVRKMKTSPLTSEEVECIQEGLRAFKHDWTSVWRFIVPHRDPSLLPRQWRVAIGTQRSYKSDAAKKEKRRVYESNRRRCKTANLANWHQVSGKEDNRIHPTGGENNSGDDYVDNPNEAYVHQAFLADWRPDAPNLTSSERLCSNLRDKNLPPGALSREGSHIRNQSHFVDMHGFAHAHYYQYPHSMPNYTNVRHCPPNSMQLNHQVFDRTQSAVKSQLFMWPYWTRRTEGAHLVKLAPDLPPVNLPATVRIISQAALKSNECGVPIKQHALGGITKDAGKDNIVHRAPLNANLRITNLATTERDKGNQVGGKITNSCPEELTNSHPEESATHGAEERGNESDLQMHPLLFQSSEDGRLSYYPLSCSTGASTSFTFFSANQPQLNLGLFHSPQPANQSVDCLIKYSKTKDSASASRGIDFHPLLQRTEEENSESASPCSNERQYVCLGSKSAQFQNPLVAVQTKSPVHIGPSATGTKPSCPIEKINELDLEIHLSMSTTEKIRGSGDVGANNQLNLSNSAVNSGKTIEKRKSNCPTVQSNLNLGVDVSAAPRINDNLEDQSLPEIVMEQEELSDSDEETEEHVEFECEEMADSDAEESLSCASPAEEQHKEFPSFETGGVTSPVHQMEDSSFSKLNLTSLGKDATNSSWLTLDSCASIDPPSMKAKHEECTLTVSPAAKKLTACRPNRSCKKTTPSKIKVATEKDVADMAQQLSLGFLAVSTLKKPRKRVGRANTDLITARKNENFSCELDKIG